MILLGGAFTPPLFFLSCSLEWVGCPSHDLGMLWLSLWVLVFPPLTILWARVTYPKITFGFRWYWHLPHALLISMSFNAWIIGSPSLDRLGWLFWLLVILGLPIGVCLWIFCHKGDRASAWLLAVSGLTAIALGLVDYLVVENFTPHR